MTEKVPKKLVVPCSGIGKVHGLLGREAMLELVERQHPGDFDTVCLALLVVGDPETNAKIQQQPCITVDGCPKACAKKNVELAGGTVEHALWVVGALKRHRGVNAGTGTALSDDGWEIAAEIAGDIAAGCPDAGKKE